MSESPSRTSESPSRTPDLVALAPRACDPPLDSRGVERLRAATLTLLEEVGVHVPSARAREILSDHGAEVGGDDVVRLPADLVTQAMATAPRAFVLGAREERLDLVLDGTRSYVCTEGVGVHVVDPRTRELRSSTTEDVARLARVCDALPLLAFFWPPVSAQDHGLAAPLYECHSGLTNTLKHVRGGTTVRPALAPYIVEMARTLRDGDAALRARSPICANICTISPLGHDDQGLECALTYAEAGIPVSFMAMTTMGTTAPATVAGALVQGDAEVVSGMVLLQLAFPGTPVFHSVLVSLMDPSTGGYLSEIATPAGWMATQLAHAWGVPSLAGGGVDNDEAGVGWTAGRRAGAGGLLSALCGSELCGYIGLAGGSMVQIPERLVLDCEALLDAREVLAPFAFDEADLALDIVRTVGPRGYFLKERHTRQHLRDFRLPPWLAHGRTYGEGAARLAEASRSAAATLDDLATAASQGLHPEAARRAAFDEYLRLEREHRPEPLPAEVRAELDRIVAAADRHAQRLV
jgi:trimethylamine--corrinoid protein Co-methyltransferase